MNPPEPRRRWQLAALAEHAALLDKSAVALRHSLARCSALGHKDAYTLDELDHFEALSARFARTADLLTQKLLKSLFLVLGEEAVSFLDQARLAEKLGVIAQADDLVAVRDLRNTIAHEYAVADLAEMFRHTLELAGTLLAMLDSTNAYIRAQLPGVL